MKHMKIIRDKVALRYLKDVTHIKEVFYTRGIIITLVGAEEAWYMYSSSVEAGWLNLPEDDIIFGCLEHLFEEV